MPHVSFPPARVAELPDLASFSSHHGAAALGGTSVTRTVLGSLPQDLQRRALALYEKIANLPIVDCHTHYASRSIADNRPVANPLQCFLGIAAEPNVGFDHYTGTVMGIDGVSTDHIFGRKDKTSPLPTAEQDLERWHKMVTALFNARPNPSTLWFEAAIEEVFGVKNIELCPKNSHALWYAIQAKLEQPEFSLQGLLTSSGVVCALTTDDPTASLDEHREMATHPSFSMIPTWRPDPVLMIGDSQRFKFNDWINKLEQVNGSNICSLGELEAALQKRITHFKDNGCIGADFGIDNFYNTPCSADEANSIFEKKRSGQELNPTEVEQWKTYMLRWLCTQNAEQGWVQYFHQGPFRDVRKDLFARFGADVGGDNMGNAVNRQAFADLVSYLQEQRIPGSIDGTGLAKTVAFTINSEDFRFVAGLMNRGCFNDVGIKSKCQFGPPWWFADTIGGNADAIRLVQDSAIVRNWIGMLSDSRVLPTVIARMKQFRAVLARELIVTMPDAHDGFLYDLARRVCIGNVVEFLGLDQRKDHPILRNNKALSSAVNQFGNSHNMDYLRELFG